jgi:glutamate--cysteine ligase
MFHTDLWDVVRHLGAGNVGLEKEGLRVTRDGFMAQTRDPFIGNPNIVKDFSENQTEINTDVAPSAEEAEKRAQGAASWVTGIILFRFSTTRI